MKISKHLPNLINSSLFFASLLLIVTYLGASYWNRFVLDDYWHLHNLEKKGYFGYLYSYYFNWEGSLVHLLSIITPMLLGLKSQLLFIVNYIVLGTLWFSAYMFSKKHFDRPVLIATLSTAILLVTLNPSSELFYWLSVNVTYITALSFILFYFGSNNPFVKLFVGILICFNKITIAGAFVFLLVFSRKNDKYFWVYILVSVLNLISPGNIQRLKENQLASEDVVFSITDYFTATYHVFSGSIILILGAIILSIYLKNKVDSLPLLKITIGIILFYVAHMIFGFLSFGDPGPLRIYFLFPILILALLAITFRRFDFILRAGKLVKLSLTAIIFYFCHEIYSGIKYDKEFAIALDKREVSYKENNLIEEVPFPANLHAIWINDSVWISNVYIPYIDEKK